MDQTTTAALVADAGTASSKPAGLKLRVLGQDVFATHALPASGEVVIGRSQQADIRIEHPSISRRHALLRVDPPLRITDLGSANGTSVGDRRLEPHELVEILPGDVVDLGSVMIVVQSSALGGRPRRLRPHVYFEGRLEDECSRAERSYASFAVVRVHIEGALRRELVEETLSGAVRASDIVAAYGPGEYELLLVDVAPADADRVVRKIAAQLGARGSLVQTGSAFFPRDGRTPEALVAKASDELHGGSDGEPSAPVLVRDPVMQRLYRLVDRVAPGTLPVLILGETGVGKEVLAEEVHRRSPRAEQPLVRINCAALSETLLESELFGHERGAFTGAVQTKQGLLETADGGTVFLDEVGELPPTLQVKLLRVLEEQKVLRVGGVKPRDLDVRFIAATNRDLDQEVASGRFRQDLYFRLNGIALVIPPLRERVREIAGLAEVFVAQAARQIGEGRPPAISAEAQDRLIRYGWPGNIRELRNTMERAVLLCAGETIMLEHLPVEKMSIESSAPVALVDSPTPAVFDLEQKRITEVLARCGGNQTRAARLLGISRPTLLARMDRYGLPRPRKNRESID